jgi:hypothetical protein
VKALSSKPQYRSKRSEWRLITGLHFHPFTRGGICKNWGWEPQLFKKMGSLIFRHF